MTLKLTLLGGFQARLDTGRVLSLPARKAQALLAYLGARPGQAHPRDKLAALLWGESREDQAHDGLRHALAAVRRALPATGPPILIAEGHTLALNPEAVDVDVARFERCAAEGTPEALEQAAALYEGDLLSGFSLSEPLFEDWLVQERERLRELALEALAKLLAHQSRSGANERAIQSAVRLLSLDPLQEAVHRALMRLYVRQGRRGAALKQYQGCVTVLQRELGAAPEEETKQLYQDILRRRLVPAAPPDPVTVEGSAPFTPQRRPPLTLATDTPLIGRDQEMARLRAVLADAESGQGRVVALVGEAGVGKTRLMAELTAEVDKVSGRVLVGRCHESEQILPFGPWVDALGAGPVLANGPWLGTVPLAMRRELGRLLPELGPTDGASVVPSDYLKLFEGVELLLGHVADQQPTVLLLEDVHWADEMSVRLLAFIGRRLRAWRLLLMVTAREEDLVEAPLLQRTLGELEREPHVATVALGPLSRSDTRDLVQALARPGRDDAAVARLSEQVWRTSGGNPFVVIEAMRAAADEALSPGLETLSLPERVREMIGRQLDRLDERSRELVALASVVGREFEFGLLQHVSGLGEEEAARRVEELTRRRVLHSVGEHLDFTHDRVREVAYSRILASRRKVLHRRVAEALATLHASDLEPHHLALGLHYAEGEVWDQAVVHLRRAAVRAVERSANREAVACFERALDALAHLPDSRDRREQAFEVLLELRAPLSQLAAVRRMAECVREAEALAEALNDDRRRGLVWNHATQVYSLLGELDKAVVTGARALEIAERLRDVGLQISTRTRLEQAHYMRGDYERVVQLATDNLTALPADYVSASSENAPSSIMDRTWLVRSLAQLGKFADATEYKADAIRLAESTHRGYAIGSAYIFAGKPHLLQGDWAKARSLIERGIAELRTEEIATQLPWAIAASAWILAQLGDASEALNRLREGEQLHDRHSARGVVTTRGWSYHVLGRACLVLGRLAEARRLANRALEFSPCHQGSVAHAQHLLGDIATHPERFDAERGEAHYRQAQALAEPRGMRPLVAHCHLGLGRLYRYSGKLESAHEHLTTAAAMYREMDMRFWLEKTEAEMTALATSARA